MTAAVSSLIGIFGGTFDPIHNGHLRAAYEVYHALKLQALHFIPCNVPAHRETPTTSANHRFQMTKLGIKSINGAHANDCELKRAGPSYSVDTVANLKASHPASNLCLIIGMDSFLNFTSWYQWQRILEYVHLVVVHRPNYPLTNLNADQQLLKYETKNLADLQQISAGRLYFQKITPLDISSTEIRQQLQSGLLPRFLMPEAVIDYICEHQLYQNCQQEAPCLKP